MSSIQDLRAPLHWAMVNKSYVYFQSSFFNSETFYMFGDNKYDEWSDFLSEYTPPPFKLPRHSPALSFGVAGPGSGVPFHFHGPGFGETVYGRKRWFLTEPDKQPEFHPNKTTLQWFLQDYKDVKKKVLFSLNHFYAHNFFPGGFIRVHNQARGGNLFS